MVKLGRYYIVIVLERDGLGNRDTGEEGKEGKKERDSCQVIILNILLFEKVSKTKSRSVTEIDRITASCKIAFCIIRIFVFDCQKHMK